jgi:hypothetical protein
VGAVPAINALSVPFVVRIELGELLVAVVTGPDHPHVRFLQREEAARSASA